jgi:hypothetical protein
MYNILEVVLYGHIPARFGKEPVSLKYFGQKSR